MSKSRILKLIAEWKFGGKPEGTREYNDIRPEERDNNSWWYLHGKLQSFVGYDKATVNLPGFEEHSEKEVGELIWNSKSKSIAYSILCEDGGKEIYSPDVLDPIVKEVTVDNIEDFQDQEKFEKYYKEITSYECDIFRFDSKISEKDFVIKKDPIEEGHYLTIRLGLQGIYTSVNYWKDNNWMVQVADGSSVVARTREPLKLKNYEQDT